MRILFCNIAWLKYYKGLGQGEVVPNTGGSYVKQYGSGNEVFNFLPVDLCFADRSLPDGKYCLGFVMTNSQGENGLSQLHIERIEGCQACAKEEFVDNVLVVYCAAHPAYGHTAVVGWYRDALVYRRHQCAEFDDGEQWFNALARAENCVLLPPSERARITKWKVPRRNSGAAFGFGRANVWFADEGEDNVYLQDFLKRLTGQITAYAGENWLYRYPEQT